MSIYPKDIYPANRIGPVIDRDYNEPESIASVLRDIFAPVDRALHDELFLIASELQSVRNEIEGGY